MKIYMDNCCYNRPYDDQTQIRIYLETEAKLYIQEQIRNGEFELVTSYMLEYENGKIDFLIKRKQLLNLWIQMNHIMLELRGK